MILDENSEHHASDLEWMLHSQQVDDEIMVELLLDEYYADIYQLVLSRLEYPELAAQAAQLQDIYTMESTNSGLRY